MTMTVELLVCIGGVLALALAALLSSRNSGVLPRPFYDRTCQGSRWRSEFPDASMHEIREFLGIFTESFGFGENQRLMVKPEDQIFAVYRALYGKVNWVDGLEIETFGAMIERKYGVSFVAIWSEGLSFGTLFRACTVLQLKSAASEA